MPSSYSANFSICIIRRKLLTGRSLRLRSARRVIRAESADACRLPGPYMTYTSPKTEFPDIEFPDIEFPDIEFPDIEFPDIEFPDIEFRTSNSRTSNSRACGCLSL